MIVVHSLLDIASGGTVEIADEGPFPGDGQTPESFRLSPPSNGRQRLIAALAKKNADGTARFSIQGRTGDTVWIPSEKRFLTDAPMKREPVKEVVQATTPAVLVPNGASAEEKTHAAPKPTKRGAK